MTDSDLEQNSKGNRDVGDGPFSFIEPSFKGPEDYYLRSLLGETNFQHVKWNIQPHLAAGDSPSKRDQEPRPSVIRIHHGMHIEQELPQGYCLKGGAARAVAHALIGDTVLPPRDIDIAAIKEFNPDLSLMSELEMKYMPEDRKAKIYRRDINTLAGYFSTRDFTINEILVDGEYLYATPTALIDLHAKVIRPTEYHTDGFILDRLPVKALRLLTEFEMMYGKGAIGQIEPWRFEAEKISIFYIALGIKRARERGSKWAEAFYQKLLNLGTISSVPNGSTVGGGSCSELVLDINALLIEREGSGLPFLFELVPEDLLAEDEEYADYLYEAA